MNGDATTQGRPVGVAEEAAAYGRRPLVVGAAGEGSRRGEAAW